MNHETCPELYNCTRVKMTLLIRVLLCCTAAEAMESICASCKQEHDQGEQDNNYVASSGRKVKVVVEDEAEQTILEHPERQAKLGQRVRTIGTGLFAIGVAYVIGCLAMAIAQT